MPLRIRNPKELPNGGYPYYQNGRKFPPMVSFAHQVSEIVTFRKDNKLPRANPVDVDEDLNNFTCNERPQICYDSQAARVVESAYRKVGGGCGSCGGSRA